MQWPLLDKYVDEKVLIPLKTYRLNHIPKAIKLCEWENTKYKTNEEVIYLTYSLHKDTHTSCA